MTAVGDRGIEVQTRGKRDMSREKNKEIETLGDGREEYACVEKVT